MKATLFAIKINALLDQDKALEEYRRSLYLQKHAQSEQCFHVEEICEFLFQQGAFQRLFGFKKTFILFQGTSFLLMKIL